MEQELKEKIIFWLFNCSSYEEFETKNYYEIERTIKEKTIEELAHKLLENQRTIWNIGENEIIVLKTFLNINHQNKTLTTSEVAIKLKTSQSVVYNLLCKAKVQILQEINKRRIQNMSEEEIFDITIGNFNLSNRAVTSLVNNYIFTVGELLELTIKKLKTLEYMGPKTAQEIINNVHSFGLTFQGEEKTTSEEKLKKLLEIKLQKRYNLEQEMDYIQRCKEQNEREIEEISQQLEKTQKTKKLKIY